MDLRQSIENAICNGLEARLTYRCLKFQVLAKVRQLRGSSSRGTAVAAQPVAISCCQHVRNESLPLERKDGMSLGLAIEPGCIDSLSRSRAFFFLHSICGTLAADECCHAQRQQVGTTRSCRPGSPSHRLGDRLGRGPAPPQEPGAEDR